MLHKKRKEEFINQYTSNIGTARYAMRVFELFSEKEDCTNRDICEFEANEVSSFLDNSYGTRAKTAGYAMVILKEYTRWCAKNGFSVSNGVFEVNIETVNKIRKTLVRSPEELEPLLNLVFESTGTDTIECLYRCYSWMAYMGIPMNDIFEITVDEVNLFEKTITHNETEYTIYPESLKDFENAVKLKHFTIYHQNPYYETQKARIESPYLLRGVRSYDVDVYQVTLKNTISRRYSKVKKELGNKLNFKCSYKNLYLSGVFYRAYMRELRGFPADFSEVVKRDMSLRTYKTSQERPIEKIAYQIRRDYMTDYEQWKRAFWREYVV